MYKLIALDLDETLLKSDKTIDELDALYLKKAQDMGIYVVLASGRPLYGMRPFLDKLQIPNNGYAVCFNGARVSTVDDKIVYMQCLKGTDIHYFAKLAQEYGVNMHAFDNNGCFSERHSKYSDLEVSLNHIDLHIVKYNEVPDNEDIIKIMFIDEPELLDEAIKKFPKKLYEKYNIVKSAPFFLEFLNKTADKWFGIKALADSLNIKTEEIMCFGDSQNDQMMIQNAGLGIAMKNATPEVLEVAKYVTDTNNNNGITKALKKFVFNEK